MRTTLIGISMNTPTGTKLNISVSSSTKLIPKRAEGYFYVIQRSRAELMLLC